MDIILFLILVTGIPFNILGYFLIRKWAKLHAANRPVMRVSHRINVMNAEEMRMRQASDAAVIAAGIVSGSVIHS